MIAIYKNNLTDSEMAYVKVSLPLFQEHAQEIEAGKFDRLYEALVGNSAQKSAVTKFLYLSGIDPLADADVIHPYMFFKSDVKSVQLTEGMTMIDQGAFRACTELERIHFPASVESLQVLAFHGCEGLKSVSFAEGNHLELLDSIAKLEIKVDIAEAQSYYFSKIVANIAELIQNITCQADRDLLSMLFEIGEDLNINMDYYRQMFNKALVSKK